MEENKYYKLHGTEKGELFASKNKKGELILAEVEEEEIKNKIVVKGKNKEKTLEELEAELG